MDTQTDSSALDTNQAANIFAEMLDPTPVEENAQTQEAVTAEVPAEDAQATQEVGTEAETSTEDDPIVTIKVDGKDIEVPLSELKRGYQKDASANQRFEQAAELRKTADAEVQKAQAERQAYAQNLQRIQAQAEFALQQQNQIDWAALLKSDPVEYLEQQRLAQERQAVLQKVYIEQNRIAELTKAEQAKLETEYLSAQQQALLAKLPEWKDETKAKAEKTALREYLLKEGYDEQSVSNVSDSRAVVLARKAMLYDQMIEKAKVAAKKVSTLPQTVIRSGNGTNPGIDKRSAAFQTLSKSGKVEDAARLFAGLL